MKYLVLCSFFIAPVLSNLLPSLDLENLKLTNFDFPNLNLGNSFPDFETIVASRGYSLEEYFVKTEDGYILTLHRVAPSDRNSTSSNYFQDRKPVILQHGFIDSSITFFMNGDAPNLISGECGDSLGFCLLQTGHYDIWLPNSRGNQYSQEHEFLRRYQKNFWNFTFNEMGLYDTPAVIQFIQEFTGHQQIGYVGHNQGATQMFALLSLKPEYSNIIRPFIAWAPLVLIGNATSALQSIYPFAPIFHAIGGKFHFSNALTRSIANLICRTPLTGPVFCSVGWDLVMGATDHVAANRFPVITSYYPSPTSSWNLVHFARNHQSGTFSQYDYGDAQVNQQKYNQQSAPEYPLESISPNTTIAIMYGNTDAFLATEDAQLLIQKMRDIGVNLIDYKVPSQKWNNLDYLMGAGAGKLVHEKTIQLLDQYLGNN